MGRYSKKFTRRKKRKQKGGLNSMEGIKFTKTLPVYFHNKAIDGSLLKKEDTQEVPRIDWITNPPSDCFYTYICFDPDATVPSWIHMMIVNCTEASLYSGEATFEWSPPAPLKGTHRYIFGVFQHDFPIDTRGMKDRGYFNMNDFIVKYGLTPIAGAMMKVSAPPSI
jgi:phosphatidylethanolamine-binding protein (PEBP) family uncharacterized protein